MSEDFRIVLKESIILDIEDTNKDTKKLVLLTEENQKEEISLKENSDVDRFLKAVYQENSVGQVLYQVYDDENLLGYAGSNGKVLLLENTVNYGFIESGLTLNQSYLHDRYRMPEFVFILLVQEKIKSTSHVLRKGGK